MRPIAIAGTNKAVSQSSSWPLGKLRALVDALHCRAHAGTDQRWGIEYDDTKNLAGGRLQYVSQKRDTPRI